MLQTINVPFGILFQNFQCQGHPSLDDPTALHTRWVGCPEGSR